MAKVGAQRAAELTGKSKSTIQRAMNSGKLSFEIDAHDRRIIDVSELERVFGLQRQEDDSAEAVEAEIRKASDMLEMERMKMRIRALEDQLDSTKDQLNDLRDQRDQWQKQAQQVLLTSQYSQKQAEELKAELLEREERARQRKQQILEERMQRMQGQGQNQNQNSNAAMPEQARVSGTEGDASSFDVRTLWHKIKGRASA